MQSFGFRACDASLCAAVVVLVYTKAAPKWGCFKWFSMVWFDLRASVNRREGCINVFGVNGNVRTGAKVNSETYKTADKNIA